MWSQDAVCHAFDWLIFTMKRIGTLNGCESYDFLRPYSPVNLGFDLEQIATEMIFAGSNSLTL